MGQTIFPAADRNVGVSHSVVFRRVAGAAQPKAPLYLATRRGETSAAVRNFLALVRQPAHNA
jgi:hypothetical protein